MISRASRRSVEFLFAPSAIPCIKRSKLSVASSINILRDRRQRGACVLAQWVIVVPSNSQVRKPTNGYPNLTSGRHHAERNAIVGAQYRSANRSVSFEKPRSLLKSQSLEVPIERKDVEDYRLSLSFEH